ncbi:ABC transporter ATP-binding protein [Mesorhizobium sp. BR115XR7A]|uniref:ABC transporter ATP-binding protein n=1 Tax=Mesorhizobium sp. BR115XR7A TaxID=2876645 RepID=UPI001CD02710|nr:ABC transporter ATP-binding protein [Mesorhizobium sp. BR115XR7A]MBZ9909338.1 ABC transporter ATP-binding protein [Mesorhizobium sp. BR115XR7A]MBZ9932618.1 ABC transporter ATP-binding protein [Mesorhizobium sp. BR1-1-5]
MNSVGVSDVLVDIRNIGKCHRYYDRPQDRLMETLTRHRRQYHKEFWALQGVSMQISRGEAVGIIGRNGAGKSTLLQIITGTMAPTSGTVTVRGKIAALLQLGSGFNPDFTGRENVFLNGAILGFSRQEIEARFAEIAAFAEIGDFIEQPVKNYSSGMIMRLAFAVSACLEPEILIVDEALAVGDALFQRKCYARIEQYIERGGTLLFVSHSLETVRRICSRAYYLKEGVVRLAGRPPEVIAAYEHDLDISNRLLTTGDQTLKSTIERFNDYGNRKATVVETWIETPGGERVESVNPPDPFRWCYTVDFNADADRIVFGMRMVNVEGQVIYATNSLILDKSTFKVTARSRRTACFSIPTEALPPGDYFFSAGVSERVEGEDHFLHRRTDVGFLRVSANVSPAYYGMVNLRADLNIT